jgi:hypothetical protein
LKARFLRAEKSSVFSELRSVQIFSRWMPRQTNDFDAFGRGCITGRLQSAHEVKKPLALSGEIIDRAKLLADNAAIASRARALASDNYDFEDEHGARDPVRGRSVHTTKLLPLRFASRRLRLLPRFGTCNRSVGKSANAFFIAQIKQAGRVMRVLAKMPAARVAPFRRGLDRSRALKFGREFATKSRP